MRHTLFNHLNELLPVNRHLSSMLQICKAHRVWDLQPPVFVSHFEELERQLREIWVISMIFN